MKKGQAERRKGDGSGIENARGTCLTFFVTTLDGFISYGGDMRMMMCERCLTWERYSAWKVQYMNVEAKVL